MARKVDYVRKKFAPMKEKNLLDALAHRIGTEFPRMGGSRIQKVCAQMVMEVVNEHLHPREHMQHGQIIWLAISVDDPPTRGKHIADTKMVPVVLDVHTSEDIERILNRCKLHERIETKAVRLCRQAYEQNGLLSNCDLAEILCTSESTVASILTAYESRTGKVVPRRATIHDVGTGLTHKSIICSKYYLEGKTSDVVASETCHSIEAVDRYVGQYDRVRSCRIQGLTEQETAYTLNCSLRLVREYMVLENRLNQQGCQSKGKQHDINRLQK
jgi:hypothetical protein